MPGFDQWDARHPSSLRPEICTGAAFAEFERPIDDPELRIDFQCAGLHSQRSCLQGRPSMPVYNQNPHAPPNELIGKHQPGRAGPND
jgi:hypothetical protein